MDKCENWLKFLSKFQGRDIKINRVNSIRFAKSINLHHTCHSPQVTLNLRMPSIVYISIINWLLYQWHQAVVKFMILNKINVSPKMISVGTIITKAVYTPGLGLYKRELYSLIKAYPGHWNGKNILITFILLLYIYINLTHICSDPGLEYRRHV